MSTEKSEKTDHEVSLTRRALIKAGWAVPVILSIGLPVGNVFVHASTGGRTKPGGGDSGPPAGFF